MADFAAETAGPAAQGPEGGVMGMLTDHLTFFRDIDPNLSLLFIGAVITWTLGLGAFLLARLGIKPLWVLMLVVPVLNVLAIWLFAYIKWPRYEEAKRSRTQPEGGSS
jgi:hypothetical protein